VCVLGARSTGAGRPGTLEAQNGANIKSGRRHRWKGGSSGPASTAGILDTRGPWPVHRPRFNTGLYGGQPTGATGCLYGEQSDPRSQPEFTNLSRGRFRFRPGPYGGLRGNLLDRQGRSSYPIPGPTDPGSGNARGGPSTGTDTTMAKNPPHFQPVIAFRRGTPPRYPRRRASPSLYNREKNGPLTSGSDGRLRRFQKRPWSVPTTDHIGANKPRPAKAVGRPRRNPTGGGTWDCRLHPHNPGKSVNRAGNFKHREMRPGGTGAVLTRAGGAAKNGQGRDSWPSDTARVPGHRVLVCRALRFFGAGTRPARPPDQYSVTAAR